MAPVSKQIFISAAVCLLGILSTNSAHSIQASAKTDKARIIQPADSAPPTGKFLQPTEKFDAIDFDNAEFSDILHALSSFYGIKVFVPESVATRVVTVHLKNVDYRDVIAHILRNTEHEALFEHPNVFIRRRNSEVSN